MKNPGMQRALNHKIVLPGILLIISSRWPCCRLETHYGRRLDEGLRGETDEIVAIFSEIWGLLVTTFC